MPVVTAGLVLVGLLGLVNLLFSVGVVRRLREHTKVLDQLGGGSGQLVATIDPVRNANMYEGRIKLDADWLASVFTGDSQRIVFSGLTRGKDYTAQVRALGGSTGQSDWSDPSTHMAM